MKKLIVFHSPKPFGQHMLHYEMQKTLAREYAEINLICLALNIPRHNSNCGGEKAECGKTLARMENYAGSRQHGSRKRSVSVFSIRTLK